MKRIFSLLTLAVLAVSSFAITINTSKYYKFKARAANELNAFALDDGSASIKVLEADDTRAAYWQFEASTTEGCYYIKNVLTGKYAQAVGAQGSAVVTGADPVDYVIVDCSETYAGKYCAEGAGVVGITSNDRDPKDFTTTATLGWNFLQPTGTVLAGTIQSYQGQAGKNNKTFWTLIEKDEAPAAPEEETLSSPYTGIAPSEIVSGQDYYLYNVESGMWLQNNDRTLNDWHTRGQLGTRGLDFQLNAVDGGYLLNGKFGKPSLSAANLYLDTTTESVWTFTLTETGVSNTVTIKSGDVLIGARNYVRTYKAVNLFTEETESNYYLENQAGEGTKNATWQIVTREERLAKMLELGKTAPQDASWLVQSADFANNDTRFNAWKKVRAWARGGDNNGDYARGNMIMECWNKEADAQMYQQVAVPNGRYSLQLQGFYRDGKVENVGTTYGEGKEEIRAQYYINGTAKNLRSIIDGHTSKVGGPDRWTTQTGDYYVPNSMADCSRCINIDKAYLNDAIEAKVVEGVAEIGIKKTGAVEGDWVIFDNMKLTYLGPVSDPILYFTTKSTTLIVEDTYKAAPLYENIDAPTLVWSTSNEAVATVAADGTVTAVAGGEAIISCHPQDNAELVATYTVTVKGYTRYDWEGVGYLAYEGGNGYSNTETWTKLCDGDLETKYCGASGNAWVVMVASKPTICRSYSIVTGADTGNYYERNPKSWKLEGSNDLANWTVIDERNEPYLMKALSKEEYTFRLDNETAYKYFKFTATSGRSGCIQLAEVWINDQPQTFGDAVTEVEPTCQHSGLTKVTSDLGTVHTEYLPVGTDHSYDAGSTVCKVCGQDKTTLFTDGQEVAYTVQYKHAYRGADEKWPADPEDWTQTDYPDSEWDYLTMPIGSDGYDNGANAGAKYKTVWYDEYNCFWLRYKFFADNAYVGSDLKLKVLHDDNFRIYLNGTEVVPTTEGWTDGTNWAEWTIPGKYLHQGLNVMAVYIQQNWGGAYFDCSLTRTLNPVTIGETGYATYVPADGANFTDSGVKAYAVKNMGTYATLEETNEAAAGDAVVLKATPGSYLIPLFNDAVSPEPNDLKAAAEAVTADGTQYVLAKQGDKVGFAPATAGSTIAAGKGYLVIGASEAKAFLPFGDDNATGISQLNAQSSQPIYNIAGQRVQKAQKGIYIQSGKKVLK